MSNVSLIGICVKRDSTSKLTSMFAGTCEHLYHSLSLIYLSIHY